MPSNAEIREQLTGPGAPFEVVTDVVDGIEMKVYKDRMPSLRSVAEIATMRGDEQTFIVYGDRRIGFGEFFGLANSVAQHWADDYGLIHGERVAVLAGLVLVIGSQRLRRR